MVRTAIVAMVAGLVVAGAPILDFGFGIADWKPRLPDRHGPPAQPRFPDPKSEIQNPKSDGPVLRGTITDEHGRPLAGVKVQLYSGLATRWEGQSAVTGADGTYVFDPLETGAMTRDEANDRWNFYVGVRIEHETHVPKDGESWRDLEVPRVDGHVTTRDFAMTPGGTLAGEVRIEHGFAWPGLDLRFVPVTGKGSHWYATTDRKGKFATRAMVPGEYSVQWNSPQAGYPELARVKIEPGKRTSVKVAATIRVEARAEVDVGDWEADGAR